MGNLPPVLPQMDDYIDVRFTGKVDGMFRSPKGVVMLRVWNEDAGEYQRFRIENCTLMTKESEDA